MPRAVSVGLAHWKRWRIRGSGGWHGQAGGGGVCWGGFEMGDRDEEKWTEKNNLSLAVRERVRGFMVSWVDFEEIWTRIQLGRTFMKKGTRGRLSQSFRAGIDK